MKRKIIEIDDAKCNGCGRCIPNCPEGAIQLIDGKARLISDLFCDGLGACLGECPVGAIHTVEREAEPYDERKVMANIVKQGSNTIAAHLKHLKAHGETKLHAIAVEYLREHGIALPEEAPKAVPHVGGCPGMMAMRFAQPTAASSGELAAGASALAQWPVQLKLLNPSAEFFDNADLLVSADCVAHAYGSFHKELLAGKILAVFCPKLDSDTQGYVEKLAEIFRHHTIRSVTVARMTVPCCGGTVAIVEKAMEAAGVKLPLKTVIIGLNGTKQD
jgi:ferredoxin